MPFDTTILNIDKEVVELQESIAGAQITIKQAEKRLAILIDARKMRLAELEQKAGGRGADVSIV